jgi:FdhE protein
MSSTYALLEDAGTEALVVALAEIGRCQPLPEAGFSGAEELLHEVARAFGSRPGEAAAGIAALPERLRAAGLIPVQILQSLFSDGEAAIGAISARVGVDAGLLTVLATYWMRPFAREAVAVGWLGATAGQVSDPCPGCGGPPSLGRLRQADGARFLWCAVCGSEWRSSVLRCPFCGNTEPGTQGYFEVEGERRLRVEYCEQCRRWVKVIDERQIAGSTPVAYDRYLWASALYDILSEERGLLPRAAIGADRLRTPG